MLARPVEPVLQNLGSALLTKVGLLLVLAGALSLPGPWHAPGMNVVGCIVALSAAASEPSARDSLLAARVYQARLRGEAGGLDEAEDTLRRVLRESPGYDYALYELSVLLSWRGAFDESLSLLEQLLKQQPANSGLHVEMGRVLLWKADATGKQGLLDEAIAHLGERLSVAPSDANALKLRAATYLALGLYGEAEDDLRACLMGGWPDPEARDLLARVLHATGRAGAPSAPEARGPWTGPSLLVEGIASRAEAGLDHEQVRVESWHTAPKVGTLRYQYARWEFTDVGLPPMRLDQYAIRCEPPLSRSIFSRLGVGYCAFAGAGKDAGRTGWDAGLGYRPSDLFLLEGGYAQGPLLESYSTLTPDYQSHKAFVHMRIGRDGGSELNLCASYARHSGVFALGYWNDFHQRWITLDTLKDESSRWALSGYFRQWLVHRPQVSLLLSMSYLESRREELLPYWSPALFSEERLTLIVSNVNVGRISCGFSGGGSHVREGRHWGYGGAASAAFSLARDLRIGAEVSYDRVATADEWTGKRVRLFAGWR